MLGYSAPSELIGKQTHRLFHHSYPDGTAYPREECTLTGDTGQTMLVDNEIFWRADGTSFPVECRVSPIYTDQKVVGRVVSFTNVGRRRETESQLRHAQKLEAVGQLAAGIAHEINTPTQFVNDNTHFLRDAFDDFQRLIVAYEQLAVSVVDKRQLEGVSALAEEIDLDYLRTEVPQAIEQSLDGLGRIARIVQAMKEFSHPGTEEKTATDLNRAIKTTIDVSRNEWKYSAELVTELDPELPRVAVLPGEFNQVMLNLIVNAAHAIAACAGEGGGKGEIRIDTRRDGEWVEVRVRDNGTGMSEAIQKRIFEPFFTTKEVGKGSGQGLAITWSVIVDKHQGTIEVESAEGNGTTFIVRLPVLIGSH
jgi:signal transduction histidine kinase